MHEEKTKLNNLEFLKSLSHPGPFTKKQEVLDFMLTGFCNLEKLERLYKEVCCAIITSQTPPPSSSLFRFASNLAQYLGYARSINTVNLPWLNDANVKVSKRAIPSSQGGVKQWQQQENREYFGFRECWCYQTNHSAFLWNEGNMLWYLGVAEEILSTGNICVTHFKQANIRTFDTWFLPKEKKLETVMPEQVLGSNVNIMQCRNWVITRAGSFLRFLGT